MSSTKGGLSAHQREACYIQMANWCMKTCSVLLITRETCKSKPQWDMTSHLSARPSLTNQQTSVGEDVEKREPSCNAGGVANWRSQWGKQYGGFLKKSKLELPFDPAIPLLGIYSKKSKSLIWKHMHTSVSITAWFTIAKVWKRTKCSSTDS